MFGVLFSEIPSQGDPRRKTLCILRYTLIFIQTACNIWNVEDLLENKSLSGITICSLLPKAWCPFEGKLSMFTRFCRDENRSVSSNTVTSGLEIFTLPRGCFPEPSGKRIYKWLELTCFLLSLQISLVRQKGRKKRLCKVT